MTISEGDKTGRARYIPLAANVRKELKGLLEDRDASDSVLIAFAGHGVQFRGEPGSYFCPMDAKLSDRSTLISRDEVYKDLEQCGAGVKVLLVDACRNDPQADNSRARASVRLESLTRPQVARPPGGVAALFSCSPGEKAFEHDRLKHGVFYYYVIQGLKGEADFDRDGRVGVEELALFAKKRVPDFVKDEYGPDVRQMPVLRGEVGGLSALAGLVRPKEPEVPSFRPTRVEETKRDLWRLPEPESRLVAFYTFDDGTARDLSGKGNNGTLSTNAPTFTVSGYQGGALSFESARNNFITIPVDINPIVMPQITMGGWFNASAKTDVIRGLLSHDDGDFDRTLDIDSRSSSGFTWSAFTGSGVIGGSPVAPNRWTFVAMRQDQNTGNLVLDVDGKRFTTTRAFFGSGLNTTTIGRNPSFDIPFYGRIDNVFIFNSFLNDAQISDIRANGANSSLFFKSK
jgi:hypothetical protein